MKVTRKRVTPGEDWARFGVADALSHSREARRLLEEIRTEAHSDTLLSREDLKRIAAEPAASS